MKLIILQESNQANFTAQEQNLYDELARQKQEGLLKTIKENDFLSKAKTVNCDLQRITAENCDYSKGKFKNKVVYIKKFTGDKLLGDGLAIIVNNDFDSGDGKFNFNQR